MVKEKIVPGQKIPYQRWYMNEQFDYSKWIKYRGKVISYFKTIEKQRTGSRTVTKFYKVFENGMSVYVNAEMMKISINQGPVMPGAIHQSNKKEFDKALKGVLKYIV